MWFAVKVYNDKERISRDLLLEHFGKVSDIYLLPKRVVREEREKYEDSRSVMSGYMFVNIDIKGGLEDNKLNTKRIWKQIRRFVSPWGYFFYYIQQEDPFTHEIQQVRQHTGIHFLSSDPKTTYPSLFIDQARIPDEAMETFMAYNNSVLSGQEEAIIVNEPFNAIAKDRDVVRITNGPLAGVSGVLRQENQGGGKRDRRLIASFGKSMIVKYPNVRRYNMIVVREAVTGKGSQEPQSWRMIDRLVALIQKYYKTKDPYKRLRRWLSAINNWSVENTTSRMAVAGRVIDGDFVNAKDYRRMLYSLSTLFPQRRDSDFDRYLSDYIPSIPVRPFLTPAYEDLSATDRTNPEVIRHSWLTEVVVPVNLYDLFNSDLQDTPRKKDTDRSGYEYDAHVAVVRSEGKRKVIVSWGGFFDKYERLSEAERAAFLEDLQSKSYVKTHYLLTSGEQGIKFEKLEGIGGFSMPIAGTTPEAAAVQLVKSAAPAAVELWQGTRLKSWRRLLQQYVLIHKVINNQ